MLSAETREEIERRALEIIAVLRERDGPYEAEIIPAVDPQWHLVQTYAGQEEKAVAFLADRSIGVFMPKFSDDASLKVSGIELCTGRKLIFPGHLFVFVWDIEAHWRRIMACPGVWRVLMDRPEHPVVVPDTAISFIQALQFGLSPRPKGKRKSRRARFEAMAGGEDSVSIFTKSYWTDAHRLEPGERISLLHKALGLETITAPRAEDSPVPS